ncbi:PQQ-like beta-propeller repeat protein [Streptomyces sp. NBC_00873]|uniref:outer membrane protein assembly factor BamB family protein n=1 Tax=Streptomyces sp. NBC_00873 TaxID=2975852 RepID=UPI00386650F0|nr:PQQ-like beta-propeller repeat protein [Streptomyces sp. NBC_00873]
MTWPPGPQPQQPQPPQGEFGAPFEPVEPMRPTQGYGPQAPPPAQPQPGPYGYGYAPQQTPYPAGPPAGGPGGRTPSRRRRTALVAAVVAVVLVAGGGVWFAVRGGDDGGRPVAHGSADPKPPAASQPAPPAEETDAVDTSAPVGKLNAGRKSGEAEVLWMRDNGIDIPPLGADVYGPWLTGDTLAKGMYRTVSGYSAADGTRKWKLDLPAPLCAAPTLPTTDGKTVVALKDGTAPDADCAVLQMIDLTTGKAGWKKTVERKGVVDLLSDVAMGISGDLVTFGRAGNSAGYRVSDGAEVFGKREGLCQPFAFTSGPRLIAATNCRTDADTQDKERVEGIDPATGEPKWTYRVKTGWRVQQVYSTSPPVISLKKGVGESGAWAIVTLRDNGTYRSQMVGGKNENYAVTCDADLVVSGRNLDGCAGVAADGDTFYLATKPVTVDSALTNKVVAFDLNTGKAKWRAAAPAGQIMQPLRMDGRNVIVRVEGTYRKGGAVATLAPTGGAPTMLLRHPASASKVESTFDAARLVYAGGRSILVCARVSANDDEEEKKVKTFMVFGP